MTSKPWKKAHKIKSDCYELASVLQLPAHSGLLVLLQAV